MGSLPVSAVLFAKDLASLAAFYRETVGFALSREAEDHVVLSGPGFDLIVHQIPEGIADSVGIEKPPRRREHAAIKLSFPVGSIESVRTLASALGGVLDPPHTEWIDGDTTTCMGHDPEGNVFQVRARGRW